MYKGSFDWGRIGYFAQAKDIYESIVPVKFRDEHRREHYGDDCRPLGSRRLYWKYITKGEESGVAFYDCVFYRTRLIRYYEDGRIVVAPLGLDSAHYSMSTAQFIDATLPWPYRSWREAGRVFVIAERSDRIKALVSKPVELDIPNEGIKDVPKLHRLVRNRSVTKLLRAQHKDVLEQVWALASIADGCEIPPRSFDPTQTNTEVWSQDTMKVLSFMQYEFSQWGWRAQPRTFHMPTKAQFNKRFFPIMYFLYEQNRDVNNDPSAFDIVEVEGSKCLRTSPRWMMLNKDDPRHKTYPNIF
jgi:hypothetical protein